MTKFGVKTKDQPRLGIELEIESNQSFEDQKVAGRNLFFKCFPSDFSSNTMITEDGGGIEWSFPCGTFAYWESLRPNFLKFFEGYKTAYSDMLSDESEQAGMHIHIDKDAIPYPVFIELLKFFSKNQKLSRLIAARPEDHEYKHQECLGDYDLAEFGINEYDDDPDGDGEFRFSDRFLEVRGETIEFRMFNSTTTIDKFYANIQFLYSIWDYIRTQYWAQDEISLAGYLAYVKKHSSPLKELYAFLLNNKYYIKKKITKPISSTKVLRRRKAVQPV